MMDKSDKTVVVFSGGQDSTVCLFKAIRDYGADNVYPVTINYGQRHSIEIEAAHKIVSMSSIPNINHEVVNIPDILRGTSPLVDKNQQVDTYQDISSLPGGLEATFVPLRNPFFLTISANRAYCLGAKTVYTGVSQEDYGGYPDCRQEFIFQMENMLNEALGLSELKNIEDVNNKPSLPMDIITPLIDKNKMQTVEMMVSLGKDCIDATAYSHTCYQGGVNKGKGVVPCGHCHSCLLRQKGFDEYGITDPLIDRLRQEGKL